MQGRPLYTIGLVAESFDVHPETLRIWERHGLLRPCRRNGRRLYADNDLKRLSFIKELLNRGLNVAGVSEYLSFYPCWLRDDCPNCVQRTNTEGCGKRCWKEKGTYCLVSLEEPSTCDACEYRRLNAEKAAVGKTS